MGDSSELYCVGFDALVLLLRALKSASNAREFCAVNAQNVCLCVGVACASGSFDVRGCRGSGALALEFVAKTGDVGLENPIGWAGLINWLLGLAKRTEEPVQVSPFSLLLFSF